MKRADRQKSILEEGHYIFVLNLHGKPTICLDLNLYVFGVFGGLTNTAVGN